MKIIAAIYEAFKVEGRHLKAAESPLRLKLGFPIEV